MSFLLLWPAYSEGQNFEWATHHSGAEKFRGYSFAGDSLGNTYLSAIAANGILITEDDTFIFDTTISKQSILLRYNKKGKVDYAIEGGISFIENPNSIWIVRNSINKNDSVTLRDTTILLQSGKRYYINADSMLNFRSSVPVSINFNVSGYTIPNFLIDSNAYRLETFGFRKNMHIRKTNLANQTQDSLKLNKVVNYINQTYIDYKDSSIFVLGRSTSLDPLNSQIDTQLILYQFDTDLNLIGYKVLNIYSFLGLGVPKINRSYSIISFNVDDNGNFFITGIAPSGSYVVYYSQTGKPLWKLTPNLLGNTSSFNPL